ncbi:ABC transporter ATP-binding protein [archaeon]|nr:MAG: ABC transporter ATP-binding protein [archaeon]
MISIKNLSFSYDKEQILRDINLEIEKGFFSVVGSSGCGKSTLCLTLNGLIPHEIGGRISGKVEVSGMDTQKFQIRDLASEVGMVFQNPESQLFALCAEDEIAFGPSNLALPLNEIEKRVNNVLKELNIEHLRNKSPEEMSSGEKQKVAIASALAMEPKILVMDEPTANLDPKSSEEIFRIAKKLSKNRIIFLAEHDIDRVAEYSDEVAVMDKGRIVMQGEPEKIFSDDKLLKYIYPPKICRLGFKLNIRPTPLKAEDLLRKIRLKRRLEIKDVKIKSETIIKINSLSFEYEKHHSVLKDIDLEIHKGEFLAIVGGNGAGKSTLALHFNGLLKSTSGTVLVDGVDTKKASVSELARKVGYVFQNPDQQIFADTLEQEISFGPKNLGLGKKEISERVNEALKYASLNAFREKDPFSLSLGQKRRVSIASILSMKPEVIILDEPSTGLDLRTAESVMNLVKKLNKRGHTIVMITHDMELVAEYAERVVVMDSGRIIADAPTREIFKRKNILEKANLEKSELSKLGELIGESRLLKMDEALAVLEKK